MRNQTKVIHACNIKMDVSKMRISTGSIIGYVEVHMAVAVENTVFWVVIPCGWEKARRFGGICRPYF
jgi:hypothetical protein